MSQENVEVVRRVVEAFNRQDWVAWNALYHPDAEWFDPPEVPGSGVHRGRRSIRHYFDELLEIAADGSTSRLMPSKTLAEIACLFGRAPCSLLGVAASR
jgi:ketosteroid isomerase-like protein